MGDRSKIEWCDSTFNPWVGCTKVSVGCEGCYAERWAKRSGQVKWGAGQPRRHTSKTTWDQVYKWNRNAENFFMTHGRPRRVFCASLADPFDPEVPEEWRRELWETVNVCEDLDWLILTKRIENAAKMLPPEWRTFPPNVWLGVSCEDQKTADERIPILLDTPAAVRWVSLEPMLGPVDLERTLWNSVPYETAERYLRRFDGTTLQARRLYGLDWVIVGGESGPRARPMHPDWVRSIRDQCVADGVPFLFKQWGAYRPLRRDEHLGLATGVSKGDGSSFGACMRRVGKKAAGRELDGKVWDQYPEARDGE